jgi:hypothetical protein
MQPKFYCHKFATIGKKVSNPNLDHLETSSLTAGPVIMWRQALLIRSRMNIMLNWLSSAIICHHLFIQWSTQLFECWKPAPI